MSKLPIHAEYERFKLVTKFTGQDAGRTHLLPTSSDIEGPFYKAHAPLAFNIAPDGVYSFTLSGQVLNTLGVPVRDVVLDFWQADEKGEYDNVGYKLRGQVVSEFNGQYTLRTVRPGHYAISETEERCSHLHVKVWQNGKNVLTTQLYFPDDDANKKDHWFSPDRLIHYLNKEKTGGSFDFVIIE